MKKLFTFLILACAFLAGNAQVTQPVTVVLDNSNLTVDTSSDTKTATYSENGNALFTISTEAGTFNSGGNVQNLTYNEKSYPGLRIGGASNYGGIFTFTFPDNVTDVKMYINGNSSTSEQNWYLNGTLQNGSGNTSKLPATGAEPLVVSLADGNTISLGNVRFNVIFVVTYTTTLPLTVSDFSADVTEITSEGATVSASYSVENAAEGSTYEVYYKDANNEEAVAQNVTADASGATFSITGLEAKKEYKYEVSLYINGKAIENASSTVDFTTLSGPTEPFEINFAELAVNNLTFGNTIGAVSSIPETEGADYTYRDTNERIEINGVNSNYQFIVVKSGQEIVSESNFTTSGDVMLRYQNTTSIGLFNNSSGGNRYGILDLKAGDTVEIAIRNGSGANNSVEEISSPTTTYNLTEVSSDGVYTLNYTYNQARTLNYKIYSYTVNADGAVTFTIGSTYLAYVKVSPATDTPSLSNGYYLVGNMTGDGDGSFVPNPSYKFIKNSDDANYSLEVGSLLSTHRYYVAAVNNGVITYYSPSLTADTDMTPETPVYLKEGYTNEMGTEDNYLNVTFTLSMDGDTPNALSFTGTKDSTITSAVITPGNDKTNQSGTVNGQNISMQTENDAVLIFLYVPNGASNVQYATDNVTEYDAASAALLNDEVPANLTWKNATSSSYETGAYQISLTTGTTGQLYVRYNSADNEVVTSDPYNFTVLRTTPTAVETVQAAQSEAEYFNLQGVKIANPDHGIFIKVQNGKASKVIL